MKKIVLSSAFVFAMGISSVFADAPHTVNMNVTNVTLGTGYTYVLFKYGYDTSCTQVSNGYFCGGNDQTYNGGMPVSEFNLMKPIMLSLFQFSYVANSAGFVGGMQPYLQFGYSTQSGAQFYPSSCSMPMSTGGNYTVTVNTTGCQITP